MKEQILPALPVVGNLKLQSKDGRSLFDVSVTLDSSSEELDPFFTECFEQFRSFLTGRSKDFSIPLDFSAVKPFAKKVLEEMKKIPYGEVASYKELAQWMDSKAYQAVGSACGKNPFLLIYPCHRVVSSTGLGGFAHGPHMKKKLLALEGHLVYP